MSIKINQEKCLACGRCQRVCPGMLISADEQQKAYIKYPRNCWGCTACLKECRASAIQYFLGADIGGRGTYLYTKPGKGKLHWFFVKPDGAELEITVNAEEANKY